MSSRILVAIIVLLALTGVGATYLVPKYKENLQERKRLKDTQESYRQNMIKLEQGRKQIHDLKTSPKAISRVAREKFGFCKPGEKVYHFVDLEKHNEKK